MEWLQEKLARLLQPPAQAAPLPVPVEGKGKDERPSLRRAEQYRSPQYRSPHSKRQIEPYRSSISHPQTRGRSSRGSALSEFGPAIFFLFIFAVFPVLDIIGLCFGYLSCNTMNDLQLREAAKLPKSVATMQCGTVQQGIPQKFMTTVMGSLSGLTDLPLTNVSYIPGQTAVYVQVSTTVTVRPFLSIPFFTKVPGLGEPATFTVSNTRVLENPRFAIQ